MVRWGKPDPQQGEYLFLSGMLNNTYHSDGLIVKADTGYSISLNHYTGQYAVSTNLAAPQVLYVKVTLNTTQHQEIWARVNEIATQEQIPVEVLPAP